MITEIEIHLDSDQNFKDFFQMENLCECINIYLNIHLGLKEFNVNILLIIF